MHSEQHSVYHLSSFPFNILWKSLTLAKYTSWYINKMISIIFYKFQIKGERQEQYFSIAVYIHFGIKGLLYALWSRWIFNSHLQIFAYMLVKVCQFLFPWAVIAALGKLFTCIHIKQAILHSSYNNITRVSITWTLVYALCMLANLILDLESITIILSDRDTACIQFIIMPA